MTASTHLKAASVITLFISGLASLPATGQEVPSAQYTLTINGLTSDPIVLSSYFLTEATPQPFPSRVRFSDLTASAGISNASPKLMQACASGMRFPTAVLTGQRLDGLQPVFLTITLSNAVVTSYNPAASGTDLPKEQFSLTFTRIQKVYQQVNPDGTLGDPVISCWDIPTNRSCL